MSGGWPAGLAEPTTAQELWVSEAFLSFQGEGPAAGARSVFVRLANCNLDCVWCDTAYSWDWSRYDKDAERTKVPRQELALRVAVLADGLPYRLILTGGEPLLQAEGIVGLVDALARLAPPQGVDVETNGTRIPPELDWGHIVVSPKLANSGIEAKRRIKPDVLVALGADPRSALKVVVAGPQDMVAAEGLRLVGGWPLSRSWAMPLGAEPDEQVEAMRESAAAILAFGWNLSPRLHTLIWGNTRGT